MGRNIVWTLAAGLCFATAIPAPASAQGRHGQKTQHLGSVLKQGRGTPRKAQPRTGTARGTATRQPPSARNGRNDRNNDRRDARDDRNNRGNARDNRGNAANNRDNRYDGRDNRYNGRDNRYNGRDNRYDGRDNRYDGRDNRYNGRTGSAYGVYRAPVPRRAVFVGPSYCRSGRGHPVFGRAWCAQRGYGIGSYYYIDRDRYDPYRWERLEWAGIFFRGPLLSAALLTDFQLEHLLGGVIFGRIETQRRLLGCRGRLVGRWYSNPGGSLYLRIFAGDVVVATFVDGNRDGYVDFTLLYQG